MLLAAAWRSTPAWADDVQFWPTVSVYTPTAGGWRASAEVHVRWTDDLSTYDRTVYRLNGGRLLPHGLEVFVGYEKIQPGTAAVPSEQRLWEQVEHTLRRGRWSFANRVRLEERFIEHADGTAARLRYRFRVQHPLGRTPWTVSAGEELWLRLNTVRFAGTSGVEQNRITVSAARAVSRHLSVEPGYLRIHANVPQPFRDRAAHVMTMQVTVRF